MCLTETALCGGVTWRVFKKTNNPTTLPAVQTDRQTLTTRTRIAVFAFFVSHFHFRQGIARTQSPSPRNYALESSTFEMIGWVNPSEVQWTGLANEEPPWWSRYLPCQVSMLWNVQNRVPSNLDVYKSTVWLKWKVKCRFPQVYWLCILFGLKENYRMSF